MTFSETIIMTPSKSTTIPSAMLGHALAYAEIGWHVFPLHHPRVGASRTSCSCGDAECENPGKHPRTISGFKDATTEPDQIRSWWASWPNANIGIATGAVSGIVVLDVDAGKGGNESLAAAMDEHGEIPETVDSETGGGGAHIVFAHPKRPIKNSVGHRGWLGYAGLDIRGDGGYIVAPPSLHASTRRYAWKDRSSPFLAQTCCMPEWLLVRYDLVNRKPVATRERTTTTDSDEEIGRHWLGKALANVRDGTRNDTGLWLACQLRDAGLSEVCAAGFLRDYAARVPVGEKAYTEREALHSLRQAFASPPRDQAKSSSVRSANHAAVAAAASPPTGAAAELREFYGKVAARKIFCVPWPWPQLTHLTQALLPGSITVVCGDPSVGKTFWCLQCLTYWHGNDHPCAAYFLEKSRLPYLRRLNAQIAGDTRLVDWDWSADNLPEIERKLGPVSQTIDEVGRLIYTAPGERVTLDSVRAWILQQASAGKRVLLVDPITAAAAGVDRWTQDDDFVLETQKILEAHGTSLVLVTHPKKGNRPGVASGHDVSAGAAYYRFSDTNIWLNRLKKPRRVRYVRSVGNGSQQDSGSFEYFVQLHKTREGRGGGMDIAFAFGEGLKFAEQGVVLKDLPEKDAEGGQAA